jgi:hypothetical protein
MSTYNVDEEFPPEQMYIKKYENTLNHAEERLNVCYKDVLKALSKNAENLLTIQKYFKSLKKRIIIAEAAALSITNKRINICKSKLFQLEQIKKLIAEAPEAAIDDLSWSIYPLREEDKTTVIEIDNDKISIKQKDNFEYIAIDAKKRTESKPTVATSIAASAATTADTEEDNTPSDTQQ